MLKYQVRTLGRSEKRRQSNTIPIKDMFNDNQSMVDGDCSNASGSSNWHQNIHLRSRGRSTSVSSLSSTSTSSESSSEWAPIRVYTSTVRSDTTYYTFFVGSAMTTDDLIQMALTRLRLRPKDPQLFYLTMELDTKLEASDVRNVLVLDPSSKPYELQACHPKEKSKFVLMVRQSYPVKIYDYCLSNTSNYKSLLVSQSTSCMDAIKMVMQMHKLGQNRKPEHFVLVLNDGRNEQILHPNESLVNVCQQIESSPDSRQQIHIKSFSQLLKSVRTFDAITFAKLTSQFGEFDL